MSKVFTSQAVTEDQTSSVPQQDLSDVRLGEEKVEESGEVEDGQKGGGEAGEEGEGDKERGEDGETEQAGDHVNDSTD